MDVAELRQVYERFAPVVYRRAFKLLRREADAWDVVHDVFSKLLEPRGDFRRDARPMTYIYRATTNLSLNLLRARAVRERASGFLEDHEPQGTDVVEARQLILRLLDRLDERASQIACLHFCDELTQEEIGEITGLSRKTVGKELARIREIARELGEKQRASNG